LAFNECYSLNAVHINNIAAWCNIDFKDNPLVIAKKLYLKEELVTKITIPSIVTVIKKATFSHCSCLTAVTLPQSITTIETEAFAECTGLLDVYCYAETAPTVEANAFYGTLVEQTTLHVPASAVNAYRGAPAWNSFGNFEALNEEYQEPDEEQGEENEEQEKDEEASIEPSTTSPHSSTIYNLQGQRVDKVTQGIHIIDGRKVMVK
jgi:hypothetical protein